MGPLVFQLQILNGKRKGLRLDLSKAGEFGVGQRETAQIRIDDPWVSWDHARIFWQNQELWIEDLASTNGTYVNCNRIKRERLNHESVIFFGKTHALITHAQSTPTTDYQRGLRRATDSRRLWARSRSPDNASQPSAPANARAFNAGGAPPGRRPSDPFASGDDFDLFESDDSAELSMFANANSQEFTDQRRFDGLQSGLEPFNAKLLERETSSPNALPPGPAGGPGLTSRLARPPYPNLGGVPVAGGPPMGGQSGFPLGASSLGPPPADMGSQPPLGFSGNFGGSGGLASSGFASGAPASSGPLSLQGLGVPPPLGASSSGFASSRGEARLAADPMPNLPQNIDSLLSDSALDDLNDLLATSNLSAPNLPPPSPTPPRGMPAPSRDSNDQTSGFGPPTTGRTERPESIKASLGMSNRQLLATSTEDINFPPPPPGLVEAEKERPASTPSHAPASTSGDDKLPPRAELARRLSLLQGENIRLRSAFQAAQAQGQDAVIAASRALRDEELTRLNQELAEARASIAEAQSELESRARELDRLTHAMIEKEDLIESLKRRFEVRN